MAIKHYTQEIVFQIMKKFDEICRVNKLHYSLGFDTLYGACRLEGFLPSSYMAHMIMPHQDYVRFLKIANEILDLPYYIENFENNTEAKYVYTLMKKRSKVRLPQERKKDERYYDYCIMIVPLLPVADDQNTYYESVESYIHNMSIVNVTTTGPDLNSARTRKYRKVNIPLLKEDKKCAFDIVKQMLQDSMLLSERKYVLLPIDIYEERGTVLPEINKMNRRQCNGCVNKYETYTQFRNVYFEGYKFQIIETAEEWLQDYYNELIGTLEKDKGNLLVLRGFEELRRMQLLQLDLMLEIKRICEKNHIPYFVFFGTLLGAMRHKGFIPWDYDADIVMFKKDYDRFFEAAKQDLNHNKFYVSVNDEKNIYVHNVYARIGIKYTNCAIYEQRINAEKEGVAMDIFPLFNGASSRMAAKRQTWWCNYVFKPMAWAHNRAKYIPFNRKNIYYKIVRFVPLKWSYRAYEYFANMYEEKDTDYCAWLIVKSNPYGSILCNKNAYKDLVQVEFEGHSFPVPRDTDGMLKALYGEQYMEYPAPFKRMIAHTYFHLDTGDYEVDITSGLGEEQYE